MPNRSIPLGTLLISPIVLVSMATSGPTGAGARELSGPSAPIEARDPARGKVIFEGKGNCSTCHARDGRGTPLGPNLTDAEWLHISGKVEEIEAIIRSGVPRPRHHPAPMPPMGGARLRPEEVKAVAEYVFSLGSRTVPPR